jgi:hypothetical protein
MIVARGLALRIVTALNDRGVGSTSRDSNYNSVGRLSVQTSVYERHLLKTGASVSGAGTREL